MAISQTGKNLLEHIKKTEINKITNEVENSMQFKFYNDRYGSRILEVTDAFILWPNFDGHPTKFEKTGRRYFNIIVDGPVRDTAGNIVMDEVTNSPLELVDVLKKEHFNIKSAPLDPEDPSQGMFHYIEVKLGFDSKFPPKIRLYTTYKGDRKRTELTKETLATLNSITMVRADLVLRGYTSDMYPDKTTAWCNELNVIAEEESPKFNGYYDEYDESIDSAITEADNNDDSSF
jgi:hypothetical protein